MHRLMRASPEVGRSKQESIEIVVLLPGTIGPKKAEHLAFLDGEAHSVIGNDALRRFELLVQIRDLYVCSPASPLCPRPCSSPLYHAVASAVTWGVRGLPGRRSESIAHRRAGMGPGCSPARPVAESAPGGQGTERPDDADRRLLMPLAQRVVAHACAMSSRFAPGEAPSTVTARSLASMTATATGPPTASRSARLSSVATPSGSSGPRLADTLCGGRRLGVGPSIA